jgi:CO/xanthine dehydrogenase FAD-binding subunit
LNDRALSPTTLAEATRWLASEPDLRPVAGCTDLMVTDALRRRALRRVLDVTRIAELRGLRAEEQGLAIGAAVTFAELAADARVVTHFPALAAAARQVGGWQIQNRATLGGNLANASPAGDSPPVLLALGAGVRLVSAAGERLLPYEDFHVGYRETALAPAELLSEVRLPWPEPGARQGFRKVGTRAAQAISKVAVASCGRVEGGTIAALRVGAASVAATPIRLRAAEDAAVGRPANAETADAVGRAAAAGVEPIDDVRSSAEYRRFALERVVRRLILGLIEATP